MKHFLINCIVIERKGAFLEDFAFFVCERCLRPDSYNTRLFEKKMHLVLDFACGDTVVGIHEGDKLSFCSLDASVETHSRTITLFIAIYFQARILGFIYLGNFVCLIS